MASFRSHLWWQKAVEPFSRECQSPTQNHNTTETVVHELLFSHIVFVCLFSHPGLTSCTTDPSPTATAKQCPQVPKKQWQATCTTGMCAHVKCSSSVALRLLRRLYGVCRMFWQKSQLSQKYNRSKWENHWHNILTCKTNVNCSDQMI